MLHGVARSPRGRLLDWAGSATTAAMAMSPTSTPSHIPPSRMSYNLPWTRTSTGRDADHERDGDWILLHASAVSCISCATVLTCGVRFGVISTGPLSPEGDGVHARGRQGCELLHVRPIVHARGSGARTRMHGIDRQISLMDEDKDEDEERPSSPRGRHHSLRARRGGRHTGNTPRTGAARRRQGSAWSPCAIALHTYVGEPVYLASSETHRS